MHKTTPSPKYVRHTHKRARAHTMCKKNRITSITISNTMHKTAPTPKKNDTCDRNKSLVKPVTKTRGALTFPVAERTVEGRVWIGVAQQPILCCITQKHTHSVVSQNTHTLLYRPKTHCCITKSTHTLLYHPNIHTLCCITHK